MARPRQYTDAELLLGARTCFLEHGPGVSTNLIAEHLGVSQSVLFQRFGSKRDLLLAALKPDASPAWLASLGDGPVDGPLEDQLTAIATGALAFFADLVPRVMVLSAAGISRSELFEKYDVPPPVRAHLALKAWFEQAQAQGRIRVDDCLVLAQGFLGALHVRAFLRKLDERQLPMLGDDQTYARQMVRIFMGGIAVEES